MIVNVCVIDADHERTQSTSRHSSTRPDIFSDSFVIIQGPEFAKAQYKRDLKARRKTIAVHPLFPAAGPRKSLSHIHEHRPSVVGLARFADLHQIHSSTEEDLDTDNKSTDIPKTHSSGRRASAFVRADDIESDDLSEKGAARDRSHSLTVPVVQYRRISQGQRHAVYAPRKPRKYSAGK